MESSPRGARLAVAWKALPGAWATRAQWRGVAGREGRGWRRGGGEWVRLDPCAYLPNIRGSVGGRRVSRMGKGKPRRLWRESGYRTF